MWSKQTALDPLNQRRAASERALSPETLSALEVRNMHVHAAESFFKIFQDLACGSVVVDRNARITWIDEKYISFLELPGRC